MDDGYVDQPPVESRLSGARAGRQHGDPDGPLPIPGGPTQGEYNGRWVIVVVVVVMVKAGSAFGLVLVEATVAVLVVEGVGREG